MIAPDAIPPTERACIMPPAPVEPAAPTLPDLCRAAVALCDVYASAHETALRCASKGERAGEACRELSHSRRELSCALENLVDALPPGGAAASIWWERARLVGDCILDADAWGTELAQMAAAADDEARTTEPGEVAP